MSKILRTGLGVAVLAALFTLGGAGAASAQTTVPSLTCAATDPTSPCIEYCRIEEAGQYPCGVGNVQKPNVGTFSFSVPLSERMQTATGVKGDLGGSGTSSITMNAGTNTVCATTSWSGIDSPVVMAHIHQGGYAKPENPAITISLFAPDMLNGRSSPASGCDTVPAAEMDFIRKCPGLFNVVVHSQKHPVGAIRGQLGSNCIR